MVRFFAVADYGEVKMLRKALETIPSLSAAVQKTVSIGDPDVENTSEISVIYKGSVQDLCAAASRALSSGPVSFAASVRPRGRHLIEVRLRHDATEGELEGRKLGTDSDTKSMIQHASTATIGVRSPTSAN